MRFRNAPFLRKTHQKFRVHTIVFSAFSPSTPKRLNTLENATTVICTFDKSTQIDWIGVHVMWTRLVFSKAFVFAVHTKCLHSGERFHMYAFSMKTISVFDRSSVDDSRKRIEKYAFSNENPLVWSGTYSCSRNFRRPIDLRVELSLETFPKFEWTSLQEKIVLKWALFKSRCFYPIWGYFDR